jgi:hypothetical protein
MEGLTGGNLRWNRGECGNTLPASVRWVTTVSRAVCRSAQRHGAVLARRFWVGADAVVGVAVDPPAKGRKYRCGDQAHIQVDTPTRPVSLAPGAKLNYIYLGIKTIFREAKSLILSELAYPFEHR